MPYLKQGPKCRICKWNAFYPLLLWVKYNNMNDQGGRVVGMKKDRRLFFSWVFWKHKSLYWNSIKLRTKSQNCTEISSDWTIAQHNVWNWISFRVIFCNIVQDFESNEPLSKKKLSLWGARWLSGRVSDSGARGPGFETYRRRVVSLSKTLYWLITQEAVAPSRHDWKMLTGTLSLNTNKQISWKVGHCITDHGFVPCMYIYI